MRVAVIAEIRLYRDGLVQALRTSGVAVAGSSGHARGGIELVRRTRPLVAIADLGMPGAAELPEALHRVAPEIRIVGLGVVGQDDVPVRGRSGIAGYVPRDGTIADLLVTLHRVARGELSSPRVTTGGPHTSLATVGSVRHPGDWAARLTARELEVVDLIDEGLTNKEIARQLGIEHSTVKNHVHNILEKLEVRRRSQAAARVRRDRLRSIGIAPARAGA
jgi:DNA-binding NarL/FixJ family response regulator